MPGKSNYFIGSDPQKWLKNIPSYTGVQYRNVYPGVDLIYYGNQRQLEYDWVVAPGANPNSINLAIEGARRMHIDAQGDLVLSTEGGEVRQRKPVFYQEDGGVRKLVSGRYVIRDRNKVGFEIGAYDTSKPLVIDPVLLYATFLGGSNFEEALGIKVDSSGNAYVTGYTFSNNFPTTAGALKTSFGAGSIHAFVAKLNNTGTAFLYSTYLGGSGEDRGFSIALDSASNAYVTGLTTSIDFPVPSDAAQHSLGGGTDAFIVKLNSAGNSLLYSTFLGGNGDEAGNSIVVDSANNAYLTGPTTSPNIITQFGVAQRVFGGGNSDAFVAKVNPTGTSFVYFTYLGGNGDDKGNGIALDSVGNAYVTGTTTSTDLATTFGAVQPTSLSESDAFVVKLNTTATSFIYFTYLGGDGVDQGLGIAVDSANNAYVTGATTSSNLLTTLGAFQTTYKGGAGTFGGDAFVAKLNSAATAFSYLTYLGGANDDLGSSIALDSGGNAYITGRTFSTNFPVTGDAFQGTFGGGSFGGDAFVTKLNPAGSALVYSSFLGKTSDDSGASIAVDSLGSAYIAGRTSSTNFPTTSGAAQSTYGGGSADAFIAKIASQTADLAITKTDNQETAVAGSQITYTIVVSNNGSVPVTGATVTDNLPAAITNATWSCMPSAGSSCGASSGSGSINTTVSLPGNGTATFSLTGTVSPTATGSLANTATVTAPFGFTDTNPGNNSATDTDTIGKEADLSITKTDNQDSTLPGASISYTIVVRNDGPSDVTGATVVDNLPAAITNATWNCTPSAGSSCGAASGSGSINTTVNLLNGGTATFTLNGTVSSAASGSLVNTATITAPAGVTEINPGNNSATDTDSIGQADLSITKTDNQDTAVAGGSITYTIVVHNNGPNDATGATVVDNVSAVLTNATWSCVPSVGSSCGAPSGSGSINTTVNLLNGGTATFTLNATVSPSAVGSILNTATVTGPAGLADPVSANNSATDRDTVVSRADLAITKTDGTDLAIPNNPISYTIVVRNNGPSDVTGAAVTDNLPAGITGATWNCTASAGSSCDVSSGSGSINTTVNLASGGAATFTLSGTVSNTASGTLTNTASVAPPAGTTDPNPNNNSATDTDVVGEADLAITKTDGVEIAVPGNPISYTITVRNNGPSTVSSITVTDSLPAAILSPSFTPSTGTYDPITGTWTGLNLAAGQSITLTVAGTISPSASGLLSNTATVSTIGTIRDPNPSNNTATDIDSLTSIADLTVTKTDSPHPAPLGADLAYTVAVHNNGPSIATNVVLLEALANFKSVTAPGGWTCMVPPVGGTGTITCSKIAPMAPGETATFTIILTPGAIGSVSNTATVRASTIDPNLDNNSATISTPIIPGFAVAGQVTDGGVGVPGVTITFSLVSGSGFVPPPVVTGPDGRYSQSGFQTGLKYHITPSKPGYLITPALIDVEAPTNDANFTATLDPFSVSGHITNNGVGIPGVTVTFFRLAGTGDIPAPVQTDANGNFSQTGFRAGTLYSAMPSRPGFVFTLSSLTFSGSANDLNFTGTPGLAGVVLTPSGAPIPGVTITFTRVSGSGNVPAPVQTDASGNWGQMGFQLVTVYRVTPSKPGFTFTPTFREVSGGVDGVNFVGTAKVFSVGGVATPGATLTFSLVSGNGSVPGPVQADSFGNWSQTGFQPGTTYRVTPSNMGCTFLPPSRDFDGPRFDLSFSCTFGLAGRVTAPDNTGLAGVTLTFTRLSGTGDVPPATQTDANGNWSQTGFQDGTTYRVTPSKTNCTFAPTFLDASGASNNLNFVGTSTVFSASGAAPFGTTLTFTRVSGNGNLPNPVVADASGNWSQSGFQLGTTYRVTPSKPGSTFTPTSRDFNGARNDLNFISIFGLAGRVTAPDNTGLAGVTLTFTRLSGNGDVPAPVQTDANGNWSQAGFQDGTTYRVTPSKTNCTFTPAFLDASGANNNLNFVGTVNAYGVSGTASPGATLTFTRVSGNGNLPGPVQAGANGNWSQSGFQPGTTYRVTPSKSGCDFTPPSRDFDAARNDLNFTCFFGLAGHVTTSGNAGLAGVTLTFTRVSGTGGIPAAVQTDANGNWSQTGFADGSVYRVTPSKSGFTFTPPPVDVNGANSGINFVGTPTTQSGYTVSGRVTDGNGMPIAGVMLSFSLASGNGNVPGPVQTDANGNWSQSGFSLDSTYRATPSKGNLVFAPPGRYFSSPGSGLDFVGVPYTVSGRVTDGSGAPIAGVMLSFSLASGNGNVPGPVQTDANGNWSQSGFSLDSTYRVTPNKHGLTFTPAGRYFSTPADRLDFTGRSATVSSQITIPGEAVATATALAASQVWGSQAVPMPAQPDVDAELVQLSPRINITNRMLATPSGFTWGPSSRDVIDARKEKTSQPGIYRC